MIPPSPPPPGPAASSASGNQGSASADVFLVRDARLVRVGRQPWDPPSVEGAIAALLRGPTAAERADGVRTALTRPVRLAGTVAAGVPLIDVTDAFGDVDGEEQILALAQLVFTLTALPGVDGVSFALDGRPVEVPTGDGALKRGPIRRDDFSAVAPVG
ncbi:MAG: GerMN domain-containing protein [Actinomycetota bacterium]|nr:GerMN domain-containing protein [Actinomycetota bacterium]